MDQSFLSGAALAANITRAASKQTYYTVRLLVDKDRVDDAYRAYGYFRWVDDCLDSNALAPQERLTFLKRQQALVDSAYRGRALDNLTPEECLLIQLTRTDTDQNSGLKAYIDTLMAVMAFDPERRGRLISQRELNDYTRWLAVAVTEALHYFIGHRCSSPFSELRYQAAMGAHIVHMLRDTVDDARVGYYNIPREVLAIHGIGPEDISSDAFRSWVETRVQQARNCFEAGRAYLAQVENLRCRVAGYAYMRRFESVLASIEREQYLLRVAYPERKGTARTLDMLGWSLWMGLSHRPAKRLPERTTPRVHPAD